MHFLLSNSDASLLLKDSNLFIDGERFSAFVADALSRSFMFAGASTVKAMLKAPDTSAALANTMVNFVGKHASFPVAAASRVCARLATNDNMSLNSTTQTSALA